MKSTGICPKCHSKDVIQNARAIDKGHADMDNDLEIVTYEDPQAMIFKGRHSCHVTAWVCVGCGYIEYYAESPGSLKVQ